MYTLCTNYYVCIHRTLLPKLPKIMTHWFLNINSLQCEKGFCLGFLQNIVYTLCSVHVIIDSRKMQVQCALLLLLSVGTVHCRSTGAPASACDDIYPVGHNGSSQDLSTNPYQLSLSDFDETNGGEFYYVPGQQYSCE